MYAAFYAIWLMVTVALFLTLQACFTCFRICLTRKNRKAESRLSSEPGLVRGEEAVF
jgi:hypothetical protein